MRKGESKSRTTTLRRQPWRIRGIDSLTARDLEEELARGGRFVLFEFCISFLIVTLRRPTDVYFLRAGDHGLIRGLPYTLVSVLFGWWGLPWGIIYTPLTVLTNLSGGHDVTAQVCEYLHRSPAEIARELLRSEDAIMRSLLLALLALGSWLTPVTAVHAGLYNTKRRFSARFLPTTSNSRPSCPISAASPRWASSGTRTSSVLRNWKPGAAMAT